MLTNAIIAAGGYGTRLKGYKNPHNCKSLIEDNNKTILLEHTLKAVLRAEVVGKVLIVSRGELKSQIEKIANKVGIKYEFIDDSESGLQGVRSLPVVCKQQLGKEPFFLICGHAPPQSEHLQKMLSTYETTNIQVVSLYRNDNHSRDIFLPANLHSHHTEEGMINVKPDLSGKFNYFVESPFILNTEMIRLLEEDNCKYWLGSYLDKQIKQGVKIYGITTNFPPESDIASELDQAISRLSDDE